jgi:glycosyltransferase involved in cell wall biosynthesis
MPLVSVIVPCYNEQDTIRPLLEAICRQTYPRQQIEVIVADGLSTDLTREVIAGFQCDNPDLNLVLVDNPKRIIPAGLNRALEAARGDIIVRLDAHSVPYPDYVMSCVEALEAGYGESVGGVWEIRPGGEGWLARSIAAAAAHPLGVGDARYRLGGEAQVIDTVPFGAFRRSLVGQVGFFNETLLTNEDYEFNVRVRQAGAGSGSTRRSARNIMLARIWYRWRGSTGDTATETCMLRRYPSPSLAATGGYLCAQLLCPGNTGFLVYLGTLVAPYTVTVYLLALLITGFKSQRGKGSALVAGTPLAIACMHLPGDWALFGV